MKVATHAPSITLFVGAFGSGKTEVALNYALVLAQELESDGQHAQPEARKRMADTEHRAVNPVILIDLDVITPYFRSREMAQAMQARGVEVVAPSIVQHLDIPAITPQILGAIQQPNRPAVLDVGGDPQGARALGQFSSAIRKRDFAMHFVVNPYRPFTNTLQGVTRSISEIEASARLRITSLVSNPNLMGETTIEQLVKGHTKIEQFAQELNLPIAFVCLERCWATQLEPDHFAQPTLVLDRHFVMPWE
jgi:hypothetical protein